MNLIDLFAGCGGMSLGFELAGFRVVAAVEKDAWASETYSVNHPGVRTITADITGIRDPLSILPDGTEISGIIGGLPAKGSPCREDGIREIRGTACSWITCGSSSPSPRTSS